VFAETIALYVPNVSKDFMPEWWLWQNLALLQGEHMICIQLSGKSIDLLIGRARRRKRGTFPRKSERCNEAKRLDTSILPNHRLERCYLGTLNLVQSSRSRQQVSVEIFGFENITRHIFSVPRLKMSTSEERESSNQ
jgi:hypothetical protein